MVEVERAVERVEAARAVVREGEATLSWMEATLSWMAVRVGVRVAAGAVVDLEEEARAGLTRAAGLAAETRVVEREGGATTEGSALRLGSRKSSRWLPGFRLVVCCIDLT